MELIICTDHIWKIIYFRNFIKEISLVKISKLDHKRFIFLNFLTAIHRYKYLTEIAPPRLALMGREIDHPPVHPFQLNNLIVPVLQN